MPEDGIVEALKKTIKEFEESKTVFGQSGIEKAVLLLMKTQLKIYQKVMKDEAK